MKNFYAKFTIALCIFWINYAFAGNIDHFEVKVNPESVSVWEAVDLTIKAVDKDNNILKDYTGTILIFSESDKDAVFPKSLEDNSYTFKTSDQWVVKFENAVSFKNVWKNDIHVYDLSDQTDSVMWIAEVNVTKSNSTVSTSDIEILSPENWLTVWTEKINVSWKSQKNHQVKIIINNKDEVLTTTDKDWIFEKEIKVPTWESVIKAILLDSDDKEIWTSKEIHIKSDSSKPIFNNLKVLPWLDVETGTWLTAEVYATAWLTEVTIIVNDSLNKLKENKSWVYSWNFVSPDKPWDYKIDVILKDELWHTVKELGKATLVVSLNSAVEKKTKDKCENWDYSWSVFDSKCWEKPAELNAPLDLWIRNLKLTKLKTKSILTWDKLNDAESYNVYKKLEGWKLELIENVTEAKFEIQITWDAIKYDYFAVKAIAKKNLTEISGSWSIEKQMEWDLSDAIKIQTWPQTIILVILTLITLWIWFMIMRKRKMS